MRKSTVAIAIALATFPFLVKPQNIKNNNLSTRPVSESIIKTSGENWVVECAKRRIDLEEAGSPKKKEHEKTFKKIVKMMTDTLTLIKVRKGDGKDFIEKTRLLISKDMHIMGGQGNGYLFEFIEDGKWGEKDHLAGQDGGFWNCTIGSLVVGAVATGMGYKTEFVVANSHMFLKIGEWYYDPRYGDFSKDIAYFESMYGKICASIGETEKDKLAFIQYETVGYNLMAQAFDAKASGDSVRAKALFAKAEKCLRKSIELLPESTSLRSLLGGFFYEWGNYWEAIALCRSALSIESTPSARRTIFLSLGALGKKEDAKKMLLEAAEAGDSWVYGYGSYLLDEKTKK